MDSFTFKTARFINKRKEGVCFTQQLLYINRCTQTSLLVLFSGTLMTEQ